MSNPSDAPTFSRYWVGNQGGDFNLGLCVTSGQVFRWTEADGVWSGTDGFDTYRVQVESDGYWFSNARGPRATERLFRLDEDTQAVHAEMVRRGPELEPHTQELRGLRLMRPSCPVETVFSFLCTANNHIARIGSMVRKLADFGEPLGPDAKRFPTCEAIAAISPLRLRELGFGYRADTIVAAARELTVRGGEPYLQELKGQPYAEAEAQLRSLPYVGRKLADCMALYALHKTEAVPLDTHVWQAVTRHYFPQWQGEALTDLRYRTAADFLRQRFGDLAAHAQQVLFYENVLNWRRRKSATTS